MTALAVPEPVKQQLASCILFSFLLQIAFLFGIRPLPSHFFITQQHPMEVYLSFHPIAERVRTPIKIPAPQHRNPAKLQDSPEIQANQPDVQPDQIAPTGSEGVFNMQQLMESSKSIVRKEARKIEQQITVLKKKKLNAPIGSPTQYLRQACTEIHLANGMLKIVTSARAICFQPVPYFARNAADVFGIPTSCP